MSIFNATTKEGRARIRSDVHQRTWNLGGDPFTNGEGIVRLLDACKALEKEIAGRDARIAELEATAARLTAPTTMDEVRSIEWALTRDGDDYAEVLKMVDALMERRMKG